MNDSDKLYSMKLHEAYSITEVLGVVRVPGGWLYITSLNGNPAFAAFAFVPFDNEFQYTEKSSR